MHQRGRALRHFTTLAAAATAALTTVAGAATGTPPETGIRAFKPVADTYVSSSRPRTNFGDETLLHVDGAPETTAYLRFRIKKLSGHITSVTLLLHSRRATRTSFGVRVVRENEWREQRMTYATAPQPSLRYAASKPVQVGAWNAVDVTPFVDGGGEVSFALTTHGRRELAFWSREARRGPRLVVRTEDTDDGGSHVIDAVLAQLSL
jgi:hypothetical protein